MLCQLEPGKAITCQRTQHEILKCGSDLVSTGTESFSFVFFIGGECQKVAILVVNRISSRQFSVTLFIIHFPERLGQLELPLIALGKTRNGSSAVVILIES